MIVTVEIKHDTDELEATAFECLQDAIELIIKAFLGELVMSVKSVED